jgi:hypothetical protein
VVGAGWPLLAEDPIEMLLDRRSADGRWADHPST